MLCPPSLVLHRVVNGQGKQKLSAMTALATMKLSPHRALLTTMRQQGTMDGSQETKYSCIWPNGPKCFNRAKPPNSLASTCSGSSVGQCMNTSRPLYKVPKTFRIPVTECPSCDSFLSVFAEWGKPTAAEPGLSAGA
jgi:hypothetical protein